PDLACAHARDEGESPRFAIRIELIDQLPHDRGGRRRTELHPDRVAHPGEVVDMRAIEIPRALAHPEEVSRGVVRGSRAGIDARHRSLVVHEQALVTGVELDA